MSHIAQTRFGLTLLPHVEHLAEGKRYVRGCPWCDIPAGAETSEDVQWYQRAQKSGRKVIMFGENL